VGDPAPPAQDWPVAPHQLGGPFFCLQLRSARIGRLRPPPSQMATRRTGRPPRQNTLGWGYVRCACRAPHGQA
jgi:hypothetical protein